MAFYMDSAGHIRDEATGRFAAMDDYLDQLTYEAYQLAESGLVDPEDIEDFEALGGEIDLDDYPDYPLEVDDEIEITVENPYEGD